MFRPLSCFVCGIQTFLIVLVFQSLIRGYEDEQWKIDLTSLFPLSTMAFKMLVGETGQTELILGLLEMVTGKKTNHEIWKPIDYKLRKIM